MASSRVYVGRLSFKARERDIEDLFSRYGKVREILLKNGFGFVEFDDPRDAEEAVHRCNGKDLRGERIVVEMTRRPPRGRDVYRSGGRSNSHYGGGGGGGSGRGHAGFESGRNYPTQTKYRVIVENLSSRVSWQDLKDIMRQAGEVTYADAHRIKPGEGVVCYRRSEDLKRAMDTLDGKDVNGRRIKLIDGTRDSRSRSRSKSSRRNKSRSKSSRSRSRSKSASSRSRSRSAASKHSANGRANGADEKRSRSRTADGKRAHSSSASRSRSRSPVKSVHAED